jgi:putative flippase GtrA
VALNAPYEFAPCRDNAGILKTTVQVAWRFVGAHTHKFMKKILGQASHYLIGALIALALDFVIVATLVALGVPKFVARIIGLAFGITTTYLFSRRYIFVSSQSISFAQWARYALAQSVGSALNFTVSTALLYVGDGTTLHVAGAVIAGAGIGFCYNFFAARRQLDDARE